MRCPILLAGFLLAGFLAAPVAASGGGCPDAPDHSAALDGLFAEVRAAGTEAEARRIADRMWALWTDAPDEAAQAVLDAGMARRLSHDYPGALAAFDRLVAYCPHYAEGYNQRAFVNFLRQDFAAALADLDRALERAPAHVAALSGRALSLMALGRVDEARLALAQALRLNPWLPERGLARPGGPLEPGGQDI